MRKRRHTLEEIIRKLRQGEVLLGQGKLIAEMFAAICAYGGDAPRVAQVAWGRTSMNQGKRLRG